MNSCLLTLWLILFTVLPPFSPCGSAPPSRPAPPHHDSIHNVVLVVFQRTDGFGPRHVGLSHHQLDVSLLQTPVVHLTDKCGFNASLVIHTAERSKSLEVPRLHLPHSPPWWWDWVGWAEPEEKTSWVPWTSQQRLCGPAGTSPQSARDR